MGVFILLYTNIGLLLNYFSMYSKEYIKTVKHMQAVDRYMSLLEEVTETRVLPKNLQDLCEKHTVNVWAAQALVELKIVKSKPGSNVGEARKYNYILSKDWFHRRVELRHAERLLKRTTQLTYLAIGREI